MSYRPFAWIGTVVFISASAATVLDPHMTKGLSLVCGGLAFCVFMLGLLCGRSVDRRRRRDRRFLLLHSAILLLAAGTMFGLYANRYFTAVKPVRQLDQTTAAVRVELLDYPTPRYGKFYYPVRVIELDGQTVTPFQVRLACPEALECEPCDQVVCQVKFYAFTSDGMYSTYSSQLAEGNLLGAYPMGYNAYEYALNPDPLPAGRLLPMLRRYVSRGLDRCLSGDEAALLKTVLLAQDSRLQDQVYTDFRQIGCSHMLAVSGLHMTLVGAFLNLLLARLPIHRRLRSILSLLLLFLYLLLTGLPVSAVRSYVMFAFCSLAASTYQVGDTLNSLGAAVVLICFSGPFTGGSVGFALSVLATAGIALLGRQLEDMLCSRSPSPGPVRRYISGVLATSMSATLFTLPVQVAVFHGLPLLTLVSNLLLLPLFVAMLYSALPLLLLSLLDPAGALIQPFVLFCGLLARLLLKLCHWMASLPGVYLSLTEPVLLVSLVLLLLAILLCLSRRSRLRLALMALSLTAAFLIPILNYGAQRGTVTLAVSGDSESACVVVMEDRRAAVLGMGTFNSGLARQIIAQGNVSALESVLITGQDYRAKTMVRDLLSNCRPEKLWIYEKAYGGKDLRYPDVDLETVPDNGMYQALPGVVVQIADDGAKLRIWAKGKKLVLALDECSGEACDLLVTSRPLPEMDTELTLFMCDESLTPEDAAIGIYSAFTLVTDQCVTYADITADGEANVRTS